ncbi:MAG TPA: DUF481 domain-containing protein [Steroidobacteraceae bacterium]|nr:DUF481 domain-containing protein [Steroidobacteraceae bacterium]
MVQRYAFALLLFVLAAVPAPSDARDKTDVIEVKNGDRIRGEIVALEYGQLKFKTDSLGTVYVEWPDVVAVESRYSFYVETIGGRRHFGALSTGEVVGALNVTGGTGTARLTIQEVTRIDQVEQDFWERIDGSFSVGFNYAKSTDISVTSARFNSRYRSELHVASLTADINNTTDSSGESNNRLQVGYTHQYLRPHGRFWLGSTQFERNEELGLDGRLQFAGGVGTYLRQTSFSEVSVFGGVALNQEWIRGDNDSQQTVEGLLGTGWRIFRFSDPETSLTSSFIVYPGLSQWGRVRSDLNVSLRRELIEDLFFDLSLYHSYDNEPPSDEAAKDDYGIVTSLGYSF